MIVIAAIAVAAALIAAVAAQQRTYPGPSALADEIGVTGAGCDVVVRYVDRSARFRRTGTVVGFSVAGAVWLVHQVAAEPATQTVGLAAMAAVGLTGSLAGTMAAEAFRLRRPRRSVRTVSLRPRDCTITVDPVTARREQIVGAAGIGAAFSAVLAGSVSGGVLTAAAFLLLLARRWAQHRIVTRPRPALPADVASADTAIRRLAAIHGVGRPTTAAAALTLSVAFGQIGAAHADTGAGIASVALLVVGVVWWWVGGSYGGTQPRPFAATLTRLLVATVLVAMLITLVVVGRST